VAGIIIDMRRSGILPEIAEYVDDEVIRALNEHLNAGLRKSGGGILLLRVDEPDSERMREILRRWGVEAEVLNDEEWERMYSLRSQSALALKASAESMYVEDIVVPVSRLVEAVRRLRDLERKYNVRMPVIAHIGDGNLHPNILLERSEDADKIFDEVARLAVELGGSVSGEHGIGIQKAKVMGEQITSHSGKRVLEIMNGIKRLIDPESIMNPGKYVELAYEINRSEERRSSS